MSSGNGNGDTDQTDDPDLDRLPTRMQLLSLVAEHLAMAVYLVGPQADAQPDFINDRIADLLRLRTQDRRTAHALWLAHLHPDDRDDLLTHVAACRADGTPFFAEYRMLRADGTTLWVSDHARLVRIEETGQQVRIGVIKDITERKHLDLELRHSLELNDAILGSMPDMVAYLDVDQRILRASAACGRAQGIAPEQLQGRSLKDLFDADALAEIDMLFKRCLKGETQRVEQWTTLPAWGRRCIELHLAPHQNAEGLVRGVVIIGRDITAVVKARQQLEKTEARFRTMARNLPGAIYRYLEHADGRSQVLYLSEACRDLWELDAESVQQDASLLWQMTLPADRAALRESVQHSKHNLSNWEHEWRIQTPSGARKWLMGKGKPHSTRSGAVVWDSVITDITLRKHAEHALKRMAHEDLLTGLPNRATFRERLGEALNTAQPPERAGQDLTALLFIDLDGFKQINDAFGHSAGDRLLIELSALLADNLPRNALLARISSDEFAVLLERIGDRREAAALAERLLAATAGWRFSADGQEIAVTMSIGISLAPQDATDSEDLLRTADTAMYKAKTRGRNRIQFYERSFTDEMRQRIEFERGLRAALDQDALVLQYQPQVALTDGAIVGVEALLRWRHPERGILLPGQFLTIAEGDGSINAIGSWVLREAFATFRGWKQAGVAPPRLAINLSVKQVEDHDFPGLVQTMLQGFDLMPREVELELSEDLLITERGAAPQVLEALSRLGVSMAIDDFGTGRSSLAYLRQLPLTRIKIDPSFIADLPDRDAAAIVRGIVSLAASLRLEVIAEGVETATQADFLIANGCPAAQGFFYAPALSAQALMPLLANGKIRESIEPSTRLP